MASAPEAFTNGDEERAKSIRDGGSSYLIWRNGEKPDGDFQHLGAPSQQRGEQIMIDELVAERAIDGQNV